MIQLRRLVMTLIWLASGDDLDLIGHVLRHAKKQRELFVWFLVHVRAKIQWEVLFYTPLPGTHVTQVHAKILLGSKFCAQVG